MEKRAAIFVLIVAIGVVLAMLLVGVAKVSPPVALLGLVVLAAIAYFLPTLEQIREYERGVIFRFGKFDRVVSPGLFVIFPSFETVVHVDMRERAIDVKPVKITMRDNVSVTVDTAILVKVTDPKKSVVTVKNFEAAIGDVVTSELRNIVGKMDLEALLEKAEDVNVLVRQRLAVFTEPWGVQVTRMEVEKIILPPELERAMTASRAASEYKNKVRLEAEARQVAIEAVTASASKIDDTTMAYLYLDTLKKVGESKSTKIVLPSDLSRFAELIALKFGGSSKP